MAWKKYISRRIISSESISKMYIRKSGQIALNKVVVKKYDIEKFNYAIIYIDEEKKMIGLKFTNDKSAEGTHKIRKTKYEVVISAKGFIKDYKLDKIKNNIIICELDKKENILEGKY